MRAGVTARQMPLVMGNGLNSIAQTAGSPPFENREGWGTLSNTAAGAIPKGERWGQRFRRNAERKVGQPPIMSQVGDVRQ